MPVRNSDSLKRYYDINGWLFVGPALALIGLFMIYPVLWSLWMSFQTGRGLNIEFGGFANIERLFHDPVFWTALTNTMIFLVFQVPIMIVLALFMASVLNDPKLKFRGFFRTCIFLPAVTSLVASAILFKGMFATDGVVNSTLTAIGIINDPVPWFSDPFWAKVLVIMAVTWRWVGYNMIFYLAALQNIDRSIYEAASIDGIPSWGRFFRLTVPMLKPVILFTTVTSTIGTIQMFDEVHNLTAGGPGNATMTLSMYIYKLTFVFMPNFGYAATISYVIVFLVALLALAQFYVARERK